MPALRFLWVVRLPPLRTSMGREGDEKEGLMLNCFTKATFCAVRAHAHARVPTMREALEFCGCYAAAITLAFVFTFLVGWQY
jgi:hypothetical protein